VLFSEPKIPQSHLVRSAESEEATFSALQRAENSSIRPATRGSYTCAPFQCSSASRKFLNQPRPDHRRLAVAVFQCSSASRKFLNYCRSDGVGDGRMPFSALQRAENSSIETVDGGSDARGVFQCSSASRKFLNSAVGRGGAALVGAFQCSSASRKFLNVLLPARPDQANGFQCSSASRKFLNYIHVFPALEGVNLSVLFSEPKIPQ